MIYTCPKCGKKMDNGSLDLDTSNAKPSQTINCPNCGHEASTGAHFCPNCGKSFDSPSPTDVVDIAPEDVTVMPPPLPGSDPLYQDALQFLAHCHAITPMMLRDHFRISDERAAELIRQLEEGGAIGPYNNGGPRQILPIIRQTLIPGTIPTRPNTSSKPSSTWRYWLFQLVYNHHFHHHTHPSLHGLKI